MSITDELREWAEGNALRAGMSLRTVREQALAIADRIDAEHERQLEVLYRDMSDAEYVELPKDADGEYVQPSDIPHLTKANDGKRLAFCPSLELRQDGTWRLAGWTLDRYRISKPTVEDVLREFVTEFNRDDSELCDGEIIERFAAKLQLKEDE